LAFRNNGVRYLEAEVSVEADAVFDAGDVDEGNE
jgi:hypothetical protein